MTLPRTIRPHGTTQPAHSAKNRSRTARSPYQYIRLSPSKRTRRRIQQTSITTRTKTTPPNTLTNTYQRQTMSNRQHGQSTQQNRHQLQQLNSNRQPNHSHHRHNQVPLRRRPTQQNNRNQPLQQRPQPQLRTLNNPRNTVTQPPLPQSQITHQRKQPQQSRPTLRRQQTKRINRRRTIQTERLIKYKNHSNNTNQNNN